MRIKMAINMVQIEYILIEYISTIKLQCILNHTYNAPGFMY